MIDILIFGFGLTVVALVGTALTILITANNRALLREERLSGAPDQAS